MANHSRAFESIESAHQYVGLLVEAVERESVAAHHALETSELATERHRDALRLVDYKLRGLTNHLVASRRLLNDLRTLRRYLLDERADAALAAPDRHQLNSLQTII